MVLKSINVFMAYLIATMFTAVCIAVTYYWPQISSKAAFDTKSLVDMVVVVTVSIAIFSSPITLAAGLFAFFKKIDSPYFFVFAGIFAIMTTLAFIPGLAGVDGDETALWIPFMAVLAASLAGYIFWYLAIRRPDPKPISSQVKK